MPSWRCRPARSWWCRSSTRAMRSTPPTRAGARCTTRSTAPTRFPRPAAPTRATGYNPVRGAKVIAFARNVLDQAAPLANGSHTDATGYRSKGGQLVVALQGRQHHRPRGPGAVRRLPGRGGGAVVGAAEEQRPAHRHPDRPQHHDRQDRRGRHQRRGARSRAVHHPRPRRLGRRGRCATTRCWRTATGSASCRAR